MANAHHIDNQFYDSYGERWYSAFDDPVALLRAENSVKIPWVLDRLRELGAPGHEVLDVGCGGGFLANDFAKRRFTVTGVDISPQSIKTARDHDVTHSARYLVADAYDLPFAAESFDVVTNMDFLEHVENPKAIVKECARVLRRGGLFFFHTFNRNFWSNFLVIRMVEKFIKNTPKNMHVYDLFITPEEMKLYCEDSGLDVLDLTGVRPVFSSFSMKTVFTGVVSPRTRFKLTPSTKVSYMGVARKV